jgi:hypothetical protein
VFELKEKLVCIVWSMVASGHFYYQASSTAMSTRGAKRQRCIEQEDDNQSKITFEGIYVIDDFGPIIPSLSGDIDPMEAGDLHSRESITAVHELEVPSYGNHGWYASSCGRVLASAA